MPPSALLARAETPASAGPTLPATARPAFAARAPTPGGASLSSPSLSAASALDTSASVTPERLLRGSAFFSLFSDAIVSEVRRVLGAEGGRALTRFSLRSLLCFGVEAAAPASALGS